MKMQWVLWREPLKSGGWSSIRILEAKAYGTLSELDSESLAKAPHI